MPESIEKVLEEAEQWISIDGVEGIGQGELEDQGPCIVVLVSKPPESFAGLIPNTFHGFPVVLEESGEIRAL